VSSAASELRGIGLTDADLGVGIAEPGHYHVGDGETFADGARAIGRGAAVGGSLGVIAGLAVTAVAVPGVGALGLAGYLLTAFGSGGFGAVIGGSAGIATRLEVDDDRWCEIPLGADQLLLVAQAAGHGAAARDVMRRHGARCFLDPNI